MHRQWNTHVETAALSGMLRTDFGHVAEDVLMSRQLEERCCVFSGLGFWVFVDFTDTASLSGHGIMADGKIVSSLTRL